MEIPLKVPGLKVTALFFAGLLLLAPLGQSPRSFLTRLPRGLHVTLASMRSAGFRSQGGSRGGASKQLPQAIVIGVKKGGTTALRRYLLQHPLVCFCPRETHFFNGFQKARRGLQFYRSLMPQCPPGGVTMEKTPSYFVTRFVPRAMRNALGPALKLILVVRDPVQRLHSDFNFEARVRKRVHSNVTLEHLILHGNTSNVNTLSPLVKTSRYDLHMATWLKAFPLRNFLLIENEALKRNPLGVLRQTEAFLGIPRYYNETNLVLGRKVKFLQYTPMLASTKRVLMEYFRPHSQRFFAMVNRTFPWELSANASLDVAAAAVGNT